MRIAVEARWMAARDTGFGNYARQLLRQFCDIDQDNEYDIYLLRDIEDEGISSNPRFRKVILGGHSPGLYKHARLPLSLLRRRSRLDLFHFLYNAPSLITPIPFVLTVHDVSYRHIPKMISFRNRVSITLQMHIKARRARWILTDSEYSKRDIVSCYGVDDQRIAVVPLGVSEAYSTNRDEVALDRVRRTKAVPDRFILYVGTYLAHKNLATLLTAYHRLRAAGGISHKLVLAGHKGRNVNIVQAQIRELGLQDDVMMLGYVDDVDLPPLYQLADLFVFPSLCEGFGLPLLEAMACGVPVIAARSSCLPEVGGEAAVYFEPTAAEELAQKMWHVLRDPDERLAMSLAGGRWARTFTWRRTAERTLAVYQDAVAWKRCRHVRKSRAG